MTGTVDQGLRAATLDTDIRLEDAPSLSGASAAHSVHEADEVAREEVRQPAKVMRLGAMVTQLLDEFRYGPLDEASRSRVRQIYDGSIRELSSTLSPDLAHELDQMQLPESGPAPSAAELRVAQAQLVGWLEGLLSGIQASILAQQAQAQMQLRQQGATAVNKRIPGPATYP
jgi:hypothetical protein